MDKNKKVFVFFFISLVFLVFIFHNGSAYANSEAEDEYDIDSELKEYDFSDIEGSVREYDMDFSKMVKGLATGQSKGVFEELFDQIINRLFYDVIFNKDMLTKVILIAVFSAIFGGVSTVLKNEILSKTGFYAIYILLITMLMGSFSVIACFIENAIGNVVIFMDALIPAFTLSIGVSTGSVSAIGFMEIMLMAIALIEKLILKVILPLISIDVIIMLINNLMDEDYFSGFAKGLKDIINWCLKGMVGLVAGADIIQGMVMPSVDSSKIGVVNKLINMIPGGSAITGIEGIVNTTAGLIKNAIGAAGVIAIFTLCVFPIFKMIVYIVMYKGVGALIEPIADNRITKCLNAVGEGIGLLYRVVLDVAIMFIITIAIVCFSTNISY